MIERLRSVRLLRAAFAMTIEIAVWITRSIHRGRRARIERSTGRVRLCHLAARMNRRSRACLWMVIKMFPIDLTLVFVPGCGQFFMPHSLTRRKLPRLRIVRRTALSRIFTLTAVQVHVDSVETQRAKARRTDTGFHERASAATRAGTVDHGDVTKDITAARCFAVTTTATPARSSRRPAYPRGNNLHRSPSSCPRRAGA